MRVTAAFCRLLALPGVSVRKVAFEPDGVVCTVGLRRRRLRCPRCDFETAARYDTRPVDSTWHHLDLGIWRLEVRASLRRLLCPRHGVHTEAVPFARAGSRFTRDFEDLVAFLATEMDKAAICRLVRVDWDTVGRIITRVMETGLDPSRLEGLFEIGVDEVSYGADHRFLTCVADHERGGVVWAAPGRNAATLQGFFDQLSDEQKASIRAVSIDMSAGYEKAIKAAVPDAQIAFDPFHVIQLGGRATDQVRRAEWNQHGRSTTKHGTWIKGARYSLLKDPAKQTERQLATLAEVQQTNQRLYRGYLLLNELGGV